MHSIYKNLNNNISNGILCNKKIFSLLCQNIKSRIFINNNIEIIK